MTPATSSQPPTVLLLCGASGVGKSCAAAALARHFGIGLVELDDFQVMLTHATTAQQLPALHLFPTTPEVYFALDDAGKLTHAIAVSTEFSAALTPVVARRLEDMVPVVYEGDFLLPTLATQAEFNGISAAGRVRGLVLYEPDEAQIFRNYLAREGREQPARAHASWNHSEWLRAEAARLGLPAVPARPWETQLERCLAALLG